MPTPDRHQTAEQFATMLACHGVRNAYLEDLHAGMFPSSQTRDYTDVKVVSPYGEMAWNRLGRISDEARHLFYVLTRGEPDQGLPLPQHWSPPHLETSIAEMWPAGRGASSDTNNA